MSDLHTKYMGLTLRSPLVASAGPIQQKVDGVRALADAGVGAIVMYSLCLLYTSPSPRDS